MSLPATLMQASELGIRLEIVNGLAIWEAQPLCCDQKHIERIIQGITISGATDNQCGCVHAMDVYIQFPTGLKRPDISFFYREPSEEEQDSALTDSLFTDSAPKPEPQQINHLWTAPEQ